MPQNWLFWVLFNVFILAMLALDLGVFNRKAHVIQFKEAIAWTAVWVSLAAAFAVLLALYGHLIVGTVRRPNSQLALEFVTGYLIEESLSVDNLFVFLLIFRYFAVPRGNQHKVLFWGILGALLMRAGFIAAGVTLINRFHWIVYLFGAFLIYTGARLFGEKGTEVHPEKNPVLKLFRRFFPITTEDKTGRLFLRSAAGWVATPLAVVLLVIETTDVLFATDSIPAVLAVTRDPFVVYTSNVFAVVGLRSLYFALAGMMEVFHYLRYGLSVILIFIGAKMVSSNYVQVPIGIALGVVAAILIIAVVASLLFPQKKLQAS
jgi:tellurite resistance protein TerC